MAKTGYRKLKKQELSKVKIKKSKTLLPKGQNVTDTNFKVKKIVIRDQIQQHKEGEILTKRKLSCQELIGRLTHYNVTLKREAIAGLKELLGEFSNEIIEANLAKLVDGVSKLTLDESSVVRKDANKLLIFILSQVSITQLAPLFPSLSSYLICGLTHIDSAIREDSLLNLDTLLKYMPHLCAHSAPKLLPICLDLMSNSTSGPRTLSINLESKFTSGRWRINVLTRLSTLLTTLLNLSKGHEPLDNSNLTVVVNPNSDRECENGRYYISLYNKNINYNYDDNRILSKTSYHLSKSSEEFNIKEFAETLIPLLFESFIELVPNERNLTNNSTATNISSEVALLLINISNIIDLLWNICTSSSQSPQDKKWMKNKFGKLFMNSLILGRYPYSVANSSGEVKKKKDQSEINELPTSNYQNMLLAKLIIMLNNSMHWQVAISYLKSCISMSETFSVEECSLLIACLSHICCNSSENTKEFLAALETLSNSKNSHLSSLATDALYNIAINEKLTHLHNDPNFISWLDSLPEKLTKPVVSLKVVNIIYDIARRNFSPFSTSLDGLIEVILDNLKFLKVDGMTAEEARLKVAQLLYWVKDWDSEMLEGLNKAIETNYWGNTVTNQIRDILSIRAKQIDCY